MKKVRLKPMTVSQKCQLDRCAPRGGGRSFWETSNRGAEKMAKSGPAEEDVVEMGDDVIGVGRHANRSARHGEGDAAQSPPITNSIEERHGEHHRCRHAGSCRPTWWRSS